MTEEIAISPSSSEFHLIANVAQGELQARLGRFQTVKVDGSPIFQQIEKHGDVAEAECREGGDGSTLQSHVEGEHQQIVKHDVEQRNPCVDAHRILGRAVEPYHKHCHHAEHVERSEQCHPFEVGARQRQELLAAAEEKARLLLKEEEQASEHQPDESGGKHALGEVDVGCFLVALCQMDACHDAAADAKHQCQPVVDAEDGHNDVDGGKGIAACAVTHESPVGDVENDHRHHAEEGGQEHLAEEFPDGLTRKIDSVAVVSHSFVDV